jgi:HAD superfamily hydrolase (TIGR01509 family)
MSTLQALIFDVDGTIAETEEAHREAFNRIFANWDLNWRWDQRLYGDLLKVTGGKERLRHYVRTYNPTDAQRFIDDDDLIVSMHREKTALYMDLVGTGEVPLRPGIRRLIEEARVEGVRLAIATTTNPDPLEALFKGTFGADALKWFEAVAAGDMVENKKPASDVYELALSQLGLEGAQCLALEDTHLGLKAAMGANLPTVVTVSEYSAGQDFDGAIAVVDHLGEIGNPGRHLAGFESGDGVVDLAELRAWHEMTTKQKTDS